VKIPVCMVFVLHGGARRLLTRISKKWNLSIYFHFHGEIIVLVSKFEWGGRLKAVGSC
jgi:hypothetical protein